ncbi:MAG: DUF202 domain-containing protein [Pirellulales bacterium]
MSSEVDPRIFFASERTLLAWLRTGIAVIGMGFVVARFGLFLRTISTRADVPPRLTGSVMIGTGLVALGAVIIAAAAWQHRRFCRTLDPEQLPGQYWVGFSTWAAVGIAMLGAMLGFYLLSSSLE